jgi:triosephosphate isomerase
MAGQGEGTAKEWGCHGKDYQGRFMRQLIAGNWKMNGLAASLAEIERLRDALAGEPTRADILICPPASLVARAVAAGDGSVPIGGQDCHAEPSGAFTGDISAEMLRDAGAVAVIVGHSERRQYHAETDATVAAKVKAAWRAGLKAIICIGETERQRRAGETGEVCGAQLSASVPDGATGANVAIAYEPVWAIGTGRTPTMAEIVETHTHLRGCLLSRFGGASDGINVLYGGSLNPSNAGEILGLSEVGGALVGGASLKAADFLTILGSAPQHR